MAAISSCRGTPILKKSKNEYLPAAMTMALGGVATGVAKAMLAEKATAMTIGTGLTPSCCADKIATGYNNTAVAVLLMNWLKTEVTR